MSHFVEGAMVARMAEVVSRRRREMDTAMSLLDEMLQDLKLPGLEFANEEDMPGHPLGDLIVEAFGEVGDFPALRNLNPWNLHRGENHLIVEDAVLDAETERYLNLRSQFIRRYQIW